jgi:two-component system, cell cycle response regulator
MRSTGTGELVRQTILIIDDSKDIHSLVASLLAEESLTMHSAFRGDVGSDMACSLRPDLILLDIEMPDLDGFETCRRLKANPLTSGLPVIFLTGRESTGEKVLGFELGAVDYVTKPFVPAELLSRVRASLRTSRCIQLLEQRALIDPLTGLGNRAMFESRFAAEIGLRIRSGHPLACIVIDVDEFKIVNDNYGHPFGDHVLKTVAEVLLNFSRIEDVVCRLGGEEFIVLAPRTAACQAAQLAERMRVAIAHISFSHQNKAVTVTCSFGVAEAFGSFGRLMLERADRALYRSKEEGRNRVSIASTQPSPNAAK